MTSLHEASHIQYIGLLKSGEKFKSFASSSSVGPFRITWKSTRNTFAVRTLSVKQPQKK